MKLHEIAQELSTSVDALTFAEPVTHVYNPLDYAWELHANYLTKYGNRGAKILLLGMNPGPWGMAQCGIPFGEVNLARDWLRIEGEVHKPSNEHPKRPIDGLNCTRSEVSGARLWGWAKARFVQPEAFFEKFFVWNYCPLSFMEESGRNRTPDKLPAHERETLFEVCDHSLKKIADALQVDRVVGVGAFAQTRAQKAIGEGPIYGRILHPSPASPKANAGWEDAIELEFAEMGIAIP